MEPISTPTAELVQRRKLPLTRSKVREVVMSLVEHAGSNKFSSMKPHDKDLPAHSGRLDEKSDFSTLFIPATSLHASFEAEVQVSNHISIVEESTWSPSKLMLCCIRVEELLLWTHTCFTR